MAERIVPFQNFRKQQLLERCRELEFLDDVESLRCTRCNRLALEHWYTNCGHALCPNCKRLLSGGGFKCPHCDQLIQHIEKQSADCEEKVNCLRVKCLNSKYGCPLVTTVKQLQEHLVDCKWTKEQVLPAVYRGANTMQTLLEEVSSLKEQMEEMKGTNAFLLNELNERLKAEADFKKSVEMSVEDIKSRLNGLSSDLHYETTSLKVQLKDFDQSKIKELLDLKNTLALDLNHKITTLEKTMNEINLEKFKDYFVSKGEVKQLQETVAEMNGNNKLLIQMLDQKEDRFSQKLTEEVEAMDAKIVASEGRIETALKKSRQETAAISKDLQAKVVKFREEFNAQWQELSSDLNQSLEQKETSFCQNFTKEVKQLDEKITKNKTAVEVNGIEIHAKMEAVKSEINKQEVELNRQIATNVKKMQETFKMSIEELKQQLVEVKSDVTQELKQEQQEMTTFSDIEKETKKLDNKIDQLKMKTSEMEKNFNWVSKLLHKDVQTIQKLNPKLDLIEAFESRTAIEQLLNRKSSQSQLVDSFWFGSAQEQMVFESLCFKWTIKHFEQLIPKEGRREHLSDIFPVYGYQLKAQVKLTIHSSGNIYLELCFKDKERTGQEVDIKLLPMVTFIIKDLCGQNEHFFYYCPYSFSKSLQYNKFGYESERITKSRWNALISPHDESMEVLVLVEPPAIINKPLSVDGTITDTIQHYSRKSQLMYNFIKDHWSSSFLTHVGGYRVAVVMWLNWPTSENEQRLVAWIWFLSGEFDSQLGMEFKHETSVTLINQLDANKNITVKKRAKYVATIDILNSFLNRPNYSYNMVIANGDAISSGGFLVNDSLTYQVTIKPITKLPIKPNSKLPIKPIKKWLFI